MAQCPWQGLGKLPLDKHTNILAVTAMNTHTLPGEQLAIDDFLSPGQVLLS